MTLYKMDGNNNHDSDIVEKIRDYDRPHQQRRRTRYIV